AAATALRCAGAGLDTLIMSTDPAHSLADALDLPLGPLASPVAEHLWGQQLDAAARLEEVWADVQAYLLEVLAWAGVGAIEAEELSVVPGLDEVFALADIRDAATSGAWDVVVVDCAPTAETLRLLSLPDVLSWYMERVFPMGRRVSRIVGPVLSRLSSVPVAGDPVFAAVARFYDRLAGVRELLTDPARTSVRLVVNPERMVIAEARRTHTYLSLFGYRIDAIVANRLLPDAITDPWFTAWKEAHVEHLATIEEGFAPVPVLRATLAGEELVGIERLAAFGEDVYGDLDPASCLHEGAPFTLERRGETTVLRLHLPGAEADDLELGQRQDELLVRVGPYRRAMVLPDSLRRRPVLDAKLRDGYLELHFGSRPEVPRAEAAG
ncbi:MAG: ArsA family ATPase, partial [Actinomycetota bacterium]|nr:ArsA family ATPase [Actinomycetota bacterium]